MHDYINDKYDVAKPPVPTAAESEAMPFRGIAPKAGEKVRVGRFGDEQQGRNWFQIGMEPMREKAASGPWGVMIRKIADGKFDTLTCRDLVSYWEFRYMKCHNTPYVSSLGRDLATMKRLQTAFHGDNRPIIRMVRYLFESGQREFHRPTLGILSSQLANKINELSSEWMKIEKAKGK